MTTPLRAGGPRVRFNAVSVSLGGARLLDEVQLEIAAGSLHCFVGANGAGKTTLLRSLLGQLPHTGDIEVHWPGSHRTIGYVPQTLDFDRTLPVTAADFLTMIVQTSPAWLGLRAAHRATVEEALVLVGLAELRHRRLGQLSGGELKRLLLAQALVPRPALLVMDEPMNHLDRAGAELAAALFARLAREGVTIVWAHHDLAQVGALADTVTGLQGGRVLFSGAPRDLLTPSNIMRLFTRGEAA